MTTIFGQSLSFFYYRYILSTKLALMATREFFRTCASLHKNHLRCWFFILNVITINVCLLTHKIFHLQFVPLLYPMWPNHELKATVIVGIVFHMVVGRRFIRMSLETFLPAFQTFEEPMVERTPYSLQDRGQKCAGVKKQVDTKEHSEHL